MDRPEFFFDGRITLEDREFLEKYFNGYEYRTSGSSFSSMYMWKEDNNFSWKMIGDYLCVAGMSHLVLEQGIFEPFLFPPFTCTGDYDAAGLRKTIYKAKEFFESRGEPFSIRLLPVHMIPLIEKACPGEMVFEDDRPNHDYVYLKQDLIDFKGRRYHQKKNHLNYFNKHYKYEYAQVTSDMKDEVMMFIDEFNARKDIPEHEMEMLLMEKNAMEDVFSNLEEVGYIAGAIRIGGKIEALSVGGRLGKDTVTCHVEKANTEYRGLYPAICSEFCRHLPEEIKYINREEDMDLENLRKSKLSMKPVMMMEKVIARFKDQ